MLAAAFAPVHQQYLLEARQMQALSFAVHIPLVCFGIAFPAMVLFMEWLGMRTGRSAVSDGGPALEPDRVGAVCDRRDHGHDPEL